ncbi:MAG: nuclear transport factor 2 family protein [Flavihumibacter sp.]
MKKPILLTGLLITAVVCRLQVPSSTEREIRKLEQLELELMHKGDTATLLKKLWAKDYVVNNPANTVVTIPDILNLIRSGKIDYSTVERIVEKVTLTENIAISMGKEIITPQHATDNAGRKVTRRFTDVWIHTRNGWKLTARQATIVLVE